MLANVNYELDKQIDMSKEKGKTHLGKCYDMSGDRERENGALRTSNLLVG